MNRTVQTAWRLALLVLVTTLATGAAHADWNVTIGSASSNGAWSGASPDVWTPSASGATVAASEINTRLNAGTPVVIRTTSGGAEAGNISVRYAITSALASASLTLTPGAGGSLSLSSPITLSGATPSLSIAGAAYTVINDVTALQAMSGNLAGNYALGSDIDASATLGWNGGQGFVPIGASGTPFTGKLHGLGHVIDGLTINRPATVYQALIGYALGATLTNLGLTRVSVSGGSSTASLLGYDNGGTTVSHSYASGSVTGAERVGGLVGSAGSASGASSISDSYASVTVSGSNYVGGLVGDLLRCTISHSYATGSVTGTGFDIGGLVGKLPVVTAITVTDSYATGAVTGPGADVGGLVGYNGAGSTVSNSYWNTTVNPTLAGIGINAGTATAVTGLTTAQMRAAANWSNFTFTTTPGAAGWVLVDADGTLNGANGSVLPLLASEWSASVGNAHQLQLMRLDLAASYTQSRNIDAAATNAGANDVWLSSSFVPVGNLGTHFTGNFDGLGHTITGLTINRAGSDYQGLFGYATGSTLRNLTLSNVAIAGRDLSGGLAGDAESTIVNSVSVSGTVSGRGYVGGLLGYYELAGSTLDTASSSATVSGVDWLGGLIGGADGSTAVANAHATGSVTASGNNVGGLMGWAAGSVSGSNASGNVSGVHNVGGLVGWAQTGSSITNSHAETGTVTASGNNAGGLVGDSYGSVTGSYASGAIQGSINVGGLVGIVRAGASVTGSHAGGTVHGASLVGGLAGWVPATGTIGTSFATGDATATGDIAGGLVGGLAGALSGSYATGNVVGGANSVGGLVGTTMAGSAIGTSFATGSATATVNNAGGLVGDLAGAVSDSYATGAARAAGNVGGLVGVLRSGGRADRVYSSGTATGNVAGGLVGHAVGTVTAGFWNTTSSGRLASEAGTGKTDAEMKTLATYTSAGWAIDNAGGTANVWRIYDGLSYPLLRNFFTATLTASAGNGSKTYDGSTATALGVTYSATPNAHLLGTASVVAASSAVGSQAAQVRGLYSDQTGYDITFVNGTVNITARTAYTGTAATGTGIVSASFSGGGAGCTFTTSQFVPLSAVATPPPAGVTFLNGLFDFRLGGCAPGSTVTLSITYPSPVPAGTQYWKYGPTAADHSYHWYTIPATIAGNTMTFSITDGGLGDDDLLANGTIVDQGGPGAGAVMGVPTLSEWGMLLLAGLLGLFGMAGARKQFSASKLSEQPKKSTQQSFFFVFAFALALLGTGSAQAVIPVVSEYQLRNAIFAINDGFADNSIQLTRNITLTQSLPMITRSLVFDGNNLTIDANNAGRVFFVEGGTALIQNVFILNAKAKGGDGGSGVAGGISGGGGGGGGLGAGAALFVYTGATATVVNVRVNGAQALGGTGGHANYSLSSGSYASASGGGGGLGGNGGGAGANDGAGGGGGYAGAGGMTGGFPAGGAGGGGEFGAGGMGTTLSPYTGGGGGGRTVDGASGAAGGAGGANGGGQGGAISLTWSVRQGTSGTLSGGGGGGAGNYWLNGAGNGGAGGIGGGGGGGYGANGGAGGAFGGGGGASNDTGWGGAGGFGGGGGGAMSMGGGTGGTGGAGGFGGGGGGGGGATRGAAGTYGGDSTGAGGGGAALGGAVFVATGGTLNLTDASFLGSYAVTVGSGGNGASGGWARPGQALGKLMFVHGTSSTTLTLGATPLTLTDNDAIAGDGALVKAGTGTLFFNGTNGNYSGAFAHNAGTLGGSGSIGGTVTVANGATLAPGNSPGTLTFTNLVLNNSSVLAFELGDPAGVAGTDSDLIQVNGDLTLDGVINVTALAGFGAGTYRIVNYTGTLTNNTLTLGTLPAGYGATIDTSTAGQVNLVVVPAYTIAVTAGAGGTASCTPNPANQGATVTCSATPNAGQVFIGWSGGCAASFTASSNLNCTASFAVGQTITGLAAAPASGVVGGSSALTVAGSGASGNAVVYGSATGSVCSVVGSTVTYLAAGTCTVTVDQAGNANYSAATQSRLDIAVVKHVISYSAATPTGSGTATVTVTGGGPGCAFTTQRFVALSSIPTPPPVPNFAQGLADFALGGCIVGSTVTVQIDYPQALPSGTQYWKYGPTAADHSNHWYVIPATVSGSSVRYTLTDGGLGDDDYTANGAIADPGGPGGQGAPGAGVTNVPTLSEWGVMLLSLLLAAAGMAGARRRASC